MVVVIEGWWKENCYFERLGRSKLLKLREHPIGGVRASLLAVARDFISYFVLQALLPCRKHSIRNPCPPRTSETFPSPPPLY